MDHMCLTFSPHNLRCPFGLNGSHKPHVAFAPVLQYVAASLDVALIPIASEQSNLHKLYTNRMKILVMASHTRERHPEAHPPVPRSGQYNISPKEEAVDNVFFYGCVLQRVSCR